MNIIYLKEDLAVRKDSKITQRKSVYRAYMAKATIIVFCLILVLSGTAFADVGGYCVTGVNYFNGGYTLTGNGAYDIVAVAEQQVGKSRSDLHYTGAWCAAFINDCAKLANQEYAIPFVSGSTHAVSGLRQWILNRGGQEVSSPQKGDIIVYYCNSCGSWVHAGIMYDSSTSIEGNVGGVCKKYTYPSTMYVDENGHVAGNQISRIFLRPNYSSVPYPGKPTVSVTPTDSLHDTNISWNAVSYATWYDIRIYDASGNCIQTVSKHYATSIGIQLSAGSYQADVASVYSADGTNSTTYTFSDRVSFSVSQAYTVTYNANGGTGAPASQTKVNGTTLTLSSVKTTRSGLIFHGWATSANGSVA